jgi:hypothetical protein
MALALTGTTETTRERASVATVHRLPAGLPAGLPAPHRRAGVAALACSLAGWGVWLSWRAVHLSAHPLPMLIFAFELLGVATGAVVAVFLARRATDSGERRQVDGDARRYALVVGHAAGRAPTDDLQHEVRSVVLAARRPACRRAAEYATAAVVIDGPRRLGIVTATVIGLLIGTGPFPWPPVPALACACAGIAGMSLSHRLLTGGRIRIGDRVRWTYSSLGEIVVREDVDGVAPRTWVGTVATVVLVNVAVALRGMSDRWTHGLPPMGDDERVVAMLFALCLVLGALYTLATTDAPELDNAHLAPRRLEERTARQSVLGVTVCAGLIGLVAGILPRSVDPADDDAGRIEHVVDDDAVARLAAVDTGRDG